MEKLSVLLFIVLIVLIQSCNKSPTESPSNIDENTHVKLSMKITPVNAQCKKDIIPLNKLCLKLSADEAATIYDSLPIAQNEDYLWKYYDLKPFRTWNIEGIVLDDNDSVSHAGSRTCYIGEWMDNFVIEMLPNFAQITALFFPLSSYTYGDLTRCELVIDNKTVGDKTSYAESFGDTVSILYNYLRLQKEHTLTLNVYGTFLMNEWLLFTGTVTKQFDQIPDDTPISVQLQWVGPETDPIQIEVALYYQQLSIKGEIIKPQF